MVSATPLVVLGEVRTCLLPSAAALSRDEARELLTLMPGRAVRWRERPGTLAISPTSAVGVDCDLPLDAGAARIVGTVATRVTLVGGRVLQSSAHTQVVRAAERRRQTWSHYLSQKGVTEVINRISDREATEIALAEGYLADGQRPGTLDLASISERLLARIRADARLDQAPPMQAGTTRLRWTARIGRRAGQTVRFHVDDDVTRSVRVTVREEAHLAAAQRFCEDLAAHDWLLTITAAAFEEADRFAASSRERLDILAPLLQHITGLWMPGAHTPPSLRALWKEIQTEPGFSRQWSTLTDRLRDNVSVAMLDALRHKAFDTEW
ncbi:SCO2521 family protein [Nocardia sp. CDC159]|uniref:SCO2521 family protein n=1 Tax=Nocardia pulmonis TaxID=2951408 RepID=A0A9X2E7E0_9NOCA|nr:MULTISPECIES: SCO2521 family protein [Nocardia]MCM6774225.1 SCO2521 family protein [Nocardia pulmonis]MCM6787112.1 SCO2521 family protein [Nocardia sp. CDC159]